MGASKHEAPAVCLNNDCRPREMPARQSFGRVNDTTLPCPLPGLRIGYWPHTGAVTLIQRFGSALNLNIHFHMLFLDGVYAGEAASSARFRWVNAPTSAELTQLTHTVAHRLARYLERQGLLERDAEHGYLTLENAAEDPMDQLQGHSITYRIAVGPHQDRSVAGTTDPEEHGLTGLAGPHCRVQVPGCVAAASSGNDLAAYWCRYSPRHPGQLDDPERQNAWQEPPQQRR